MDDLITFLRARLDEDEAAALAAGGGVHCQEWDASGPGHREGRVEDGHGDVVVYDEGSPTLEQARHIARQDPARTLRRVTAGRRILARYEHGSAGELPEWKAGRELIEAALAILLGVIRDLAAVWSDHPDYRPEWAP